MSYRLAVVFPGATAPPRDGASAFARSVLHLLHRVGHQIAVVVPSFEEPVQPPQAWYPGTVRWVRVHSQRGGQVRRGRRAVRSALHAEPAWTTAYAARGVVEELRRAARECDAAIGFGAAASPILARVDAPALVVLFSLPLDDVERAGGSRLERQLTRRFQNRLPRIHDAVALTTPSEQERLTATSGIETLWLPFPRQAEPPRNCDGPEEPPRRLLFVADWNYPPNRAGLDFLLANVMPAVWRRRPQTELVLAGKGSADVPTPTTVGPVRRLGEYDELRALADSSTLGILPLLDAGGIRTRLIELLAAGVPVVATEAATSGLEFGGGVIASAPEAYAERLVEVLEQPTVVAALRRALREEQLRWPGAAEVAERWAAAVERAIGRHHARR